jgi:hypothetical protein
MHPGIGPAMGDAEDVTAVHAGAGRCTWRVLREMRNPPILISVIGFFAMLAGLYWLYLGFRLLGFDWFGVLGDLPAYEQSGLWGWLALAAGIAWVMAAAGLWALQSWAWTFTIIVAGFALFEAFLWFLEYPGAGVGFSAAIMPLLIIWYMNTSEVKEAFGKGAETVEDVEPVA